MKKLLIARTLLLLEGAFAILVGACCLTIRSALSKGITPSTVAEITATMENYADLLESHRATIDEVGQNANVYATALRETATLMNGPLTTLAAQASQMSNNSSSANPILNFLLAGNTSSIKNLASSLQRTLPANAKALNTTANALQKHGPLQHRQLMNALDSSISTLRLLATEIRTTANYLNTVVNAVTLLFAFTAAGFLVNALALLLFSWQLKN